MCVGIPAQVVEILAAEKKSAIVDVEGVRREVSIVIVLDDGVKAAGKEENEVKVADIAIHLLDAIEAGEAEFHAGDAPLVDAEAEAAASIVPES